MAKMLKQRLSEEIPEFDRLTELVKTHRLIDDLHVNELSHILSGIDDVQAALKKLREDIKTRIIIEKLNVPGWIIDKYSEKQLFQTPETAVACLDLLKGSFEASDTLLAQKEVLVVSYAKARDYITEVQMRRGEVEDEAKSTAVQNLQDLVMPPTENYKLCKAKYKTMKE